jgi:hypothetical protein
MNLASEWSAFHTALGKWQAARHVQAAEVALDKLHKGLTQFATFWSSVSTSATAQYRFDVAMLIQGIECVQKALAMASKENVWSTAVDSKPHQLALKQLVRGCLCLSMLGADDMKRMAHVPRSNQRKLKGDANIQPMLQKIQASVHSNWQQVQDALPYEALLTLVPPSYLAQQRVVDCKYVPFQASDSKDAEVHVASAEEVSALFGSSDTVCVTCRFAVESRPEAELSIQGRATWDKEELKVKKTRFVWDTSGVWTWSPPDAIEPMRLVELEVESCSLLE